jgi:squalene cyclase
MIGDPLIPFWEKANVWRKLKLLRTLDVIKTPIAEKYVNEIRGLRFKDGGFSRTLGEPSSVTPTAEATTYLSPETDASVIRDGVDFLWTMQNQNGGWHENPNLPKDKVPFWSSTEKGVPILTADCVESLAITGHKSDNRLDRAVTWLRQMQSPSGMWLSLEGTDPTDTEPDSTQRAISALITYGMTSESSVVRRGCKALEEFILKDASEWAKTHPPAWLWVAALDGLTAAGYGSSNATVQRALKNVLELQQKDGSWPNNYEIRVVPTLIALKAISSEEAVNTIRRMEEGSLSRS